MDPNANLAELRRLVAALQHFIDHSAEPPSGDAAGGFLSYDQLIDVLRVTELFIALDDWISHGGFLPGPWTRQPPDASAAARAVAVIVRTERIRAWLQEHDPKALQQCSEALS